MNLDRKTLHDGACVMGEYQPDPIAFGMLPERFGVVEQQFGTLPLAALFCSSYIVCMEQPGLQSLFCKLALEFHSHPLVDAEMQYESQVLCVNALNMLASEVHLSASARKLLENLEDTAGRIVLTKGDAGDLSYCTQLQCTFDQKFGRLDFLFCNACLPLRHLDSTLPEIVAAQIIQGLFDVPSEQVSLLSMQ